MHKDSHSFLLNPWSRVLLEKLTGSQLVKKFPSFYGTWRFIATFTRARHLSLSWARSIQSMLPSHWLIIHFNIILPSTPGSSKWSLSGFPKRFITTWRLSNVDVACLYRKLPSLNVIPKVYYSSVHSLMQNALRIPFKIQYYFFPFIYCSIRLSQITIYFNDTQRGLLKNLH